MPDVQRPGETQVQTAWLNFIAALQSLLGPRPDDRPLDQYLAFRDAVLAMVRSPQFLQELNGAWRAATKPPGSAPRHLLLLELEAFPRAVEVARATEPAEAAPTAGEVKKKWYTKWIGRAGTAAGSVNDLLANLPPLAKSGLTLLKELTDLFSRD
jgi:hypothetical protein